MIRSSSNVRGRFSSSEIVDEVAAPEPITDERNIHRRWAKPLSQHHIWPLVHGSAQQQSPPAVSRYPCRGYESKAGQRSYISQLTCLFAMLDKLLNLYPRIR